MTRPGSFVYLTGNPLSALGIIGGALYVCYQWWTSGGAFHWIVPLGAVMLASSAAKSSQHLRSYYTWAGNYAAIGGEKPPTLLGDTLALMRKLLIGAFAGACGGASWYYFQPQTDQEYAIAFGAAVAGFLGICGLVRFPGVMVRRRRERPASFERTPKAKPGKEPLVTVALPVPSFSSPVAKIPPQLPDYCQRLMSRRSSLQLSGHTASMSDGNGQASAMREGMSLATAPKRGMSRRSKR